MNSNINIINYGHLLNQLHTLNNYSSNKTINISQKTGDLDVREKPSSMLGRLFQWAGYGNSSSDWHSIAMNIDSLVEATTALLNTHSLNPEELAKLKTELIHTSDKLQEIAKDIDSFEIGEGNKFIELSNTIRQVSKQIISKDYEEDFYLLNPTDSEQEKQEEEWSWIGASQSFIEPAEKPKIEGFLGKLGRIVETTRLWCTQARQQVPNGLKFPAPWEQFTSPIVKNFLDHMSNNISFKTINEFYMNKGINDMTLNQIKKVIDESIGVNIDQPIAIPVLLSGKESLSRDHIVAMIIKDGKIEYFDSMGTTSDQQKLAEESGTIRDVLEYCKDRYSLDSIEENKHQLQKDIHSCGTFVCQFFIRRLENNELVGSTPKDVDRYELLKVRERIADEVIPMMEKELEERLFETEKPAITTDSDDWSDQEMMKEGNEPKEI